MQKLFHEQSRRLRRSGSSREEGLSEHTSIDALHKIDEVERRLSQQVRDGMSELRKEMLATKRTAPDVLRPNDSLRPQRPLFLGRMSNWPPIDTSRPKTMLEGDDRSIQKLKHKLASLANNEGSNDGEGRKSDPDRGSLMVRLKYKSSPRGNEAVKAGGEGRKRQRIEESPEPQAQSAAGERCALSDSSSLSTRLLTLNLTEPVTGPDLLPSHAWEIGEATHEVMALDEKHRFPAPASEDDARGGSANTCKASSSWATRECDALSGHRKRKTKAEQ